MLKEKDVIFSYKFNYTPARIDVFIYLTVKLGRLIKYVVWIKHEVQNDNFAVRYTLQSVTVAVIGC